MTYLERLRALEKQMAKIQRSLCCQQANPSSLNIADPFTPCGYNDASGDVGDITYDDNNIYIKTASGWAYAPLTIMGACER